jgi:menaquinone-specific isochorismate synthase
MPVIPSPAHLLQDPSTLYKFLVDCQITALEKSQPQIVSLSLPLPRLDPLAVFSQLHSCSPAIAQPRTAAGSSPIHFYLEKPAQQEAIVAYEPILEIQLAGPERFAQAKQFILNALSHTLAVGDLELPLAGPHFFSSFSFFDQVPNGSPFPAARIFLPRWHVGVRKGQGVGVANLQVAADSDLEALTDQVWQDWQGIQSAKSPDRVTAIGHPLPHSPLTTKGNQGFKAAVNTTLESIRCDRFSKLVLAHVADVTAPQPFNHLQSLAQLRQHYPECYVFCIGNGTGQYFLGASPERLVSLQAQELITDALAGSAPRGQTLSADAALSRDLLNSEKDLREHQVIVDFIDQHLAKLQINPRPSSPPHLLKLPNIQHLQTLISARVPAELHVLDILAQLHPTPAVAGAPREIACEQIRRHESFDRQLYAAPLGWVDHQGNGEFIVGIRSALINGCHTRLYAGAGIVAGSDPERELAEISLKLQTLLAALVWGDGEFNDNPS